MIKKTIDFAVFSFVKMLCNVNHKRIAVLTSVCTDQSLHFTTERDSLAFPPHAPESSLYFLVADWSVQTRLQSRVKVVLVSAKLWLCSDYSDSGDIRSPANMIRLCSRRKCALNSECISFAGLRRCSRTLPKPYSRLFAAQLRTAFT